MKQVSDFFPLPDVNLETTQCHTILKKKEKDTFSTINVNNLIKKIIQKSLCLKRLHKIYKISTKQIV